MPALRFAFSDLALYGREPGHNVRELYQAGAQGVEVLMDGPAWLAPRQAAASLKQALADCPVEISLHPPTVSVNLTAADDAARRAGYQAHRDALELARELGARHIVVHPGFRPSPAFPLYRAWQYATEAVGGLVEAARRARITLGLENVGDRTTSLFTADEYIVFVAQFDPAWTGYVVDTGHAHVSAWDLPRLMEQTGSRLVAVHLHDNRGDTDSHLPVGEGSIPWTNLWPILSSLGKHRPLVLEYKPGTPPATLAASCELIRREAERCPAVPPAPRRTFIQP